MWRPDQVVPQHKRRAVALWAFLITGIIAYTGWLLYVAVEKRENPSTAFTRSNGVYAYPDTWVCLYDTYGCDHIGLEENCMRSMNMTEGGKTGAVFYPGGDYEQTITAEGRITDTKGWCVEFKTSEITVFEGQERSADHYLDYVLLDMYWYPGGVANNSTTCVPDGDNWKSHREWVYIFLHDPDTKLLSPGIQTPYSCITNASTSHEFTYTGIGLTSEKKLNGGNTVSYKALTTSSATYKDETNASITTPYAYLAMELQQEPDSLEIIVEVNPLDIAEIFGNVGGFWDLILIFWPVFFVAATRQDPHLKPRNFKKSVVRGAERATGIVGTISISEPKRRHEHSDGQHNSIPSTAMELPFWESTLPAYQSRHLNSVPPVTSPPPFVERTLS